MAVLARAVASPAPPTLLLMRLLPLMLGAAEGVRDESQDLAARLNARQSVSEAQPHARGGGGSGARAVTISATTYSVHKENKLQPERPNLKTAAAYLSTLLDDEEAFVAVPEASTELLWELYSLLPKGFSQVRCLYEVVGGCAQRAEGTCRGQGLALLYHGGAFQLESRSECSPSLLSEPDYRGLQFGRPAAGLPGPGDDFWAWLNGGSCGGSVEAEHRVLSHGVVRPMIGARFRHKANGTEILAVAVHAGDLQHHVGAEGEDSDSAKIAATLAELQPAGPPVPFVLFGDMSTHGGIITHDNPKSRVQGLLDAFGERMDGHRTTADMASFSLAHMSADLAEALGSDGKLTVRDSKPPEVREFVTCCCPPHAPWHPSTSRAPYLQEQGHACGGAEDSLPVEGRRSQDWRELFLQSDGLCEARRSSQRGAVVAPGAPAGAAAAHRCMGSADRFWNASALAGFDPEDRGVARYVVDDRNKQMNYLARYKFDHVLVGVPVGCSMETLRYAMVQLQGGPSTHFPVEAAVRLTCG